MVFRHSDVARPDAALDLDAKGVVAMVPGRLLSVGQAVARRTSHVARLGCACDHKLDHNGAAEFLRNGFSVDIASELRLVDHELLREVRVVEDLSKVLAFVEVLQGASRCVGKLEHDFAIFPRLFTCITKQLKLLLELETLEKMESS